MLATLPDEWKAVRLFHLFSKAGKKITTNHEIRVALKIHSTENTVLFQLYMKIYQYTIALAPDFFSKRLRLLIFFPKRLRLWFLEFFPGIFFQAAQLQGAKNMRLLEAPARTIS